MPVVLCDAGPLKTLGKLNRLDLLASLFSEVQIPRAVYDEVVTQGLARGAADASALRLFWQHQQWPIVDVPETMLSCYVSPMAPDPGELGRWLRHKRWQIPWCCQMTKSHERKLVG